MEREREWWPAAGVFGGGLATTVGGGYQVLLCPSLGLEEGRGTFGLMLERASLGRFTGTLDEARAWAERVLAERWPAS